MRSKKTIGILAGMGPRSTAPFLDLVIYECQKQYGAILDEDFPHMMIYSLPTPFYLDRPIDHNKMKETVIKGMQRLAATGVDFIAIPCNTVHAYYDEIKRHVKVKVLNIIEESMRNLNGGRNIALIATVPTIQSGAYQNFINQVGASTIPSVNFQSSVNNLISKVKIGISYQDLLSEWMELITIMKSAGADSAIIACTDLSVFSKNSDGLPIVDSSNALAKAIVEEYLK